jgi:hypothetical protein
MTHLAESQTRVGASVEALRGEGLRVDTEENML